MVRKFLLKSNKIIHISSNVPFLWSIISKVAVSLLFIAADVIRSSTNLPTCQSSVCTPPPLTKSTWPLTHSETGAAK